MTVARVDSGGRRVSVSSWSLHRTLGKPGFYGVGEAIPADTHGRGRVDLLGLPAALAEQGFGTFELCHFHLPQTDAAYLQKLRGAIDEAGVELFSLLVDAGDIVHPDEGERDLDWVANWLEIAQVLGSRCMRVIAGKQPPTAPNIDLAVARLKPLAGRAQAAGVRLMTENWFALTDQPGPLRQVLEGLEGQVGLCLDYGNWQGDDKYGRLGQVADLAESCHAKPQFGSDGALQAADFERCLELTQAAGFGGPFTLIYDGPGDDEWAGLAAEKAVVVNYLN